MHKLQLLKVKAHVFVCIRDVGAVGVVGGPDPPDLADQLSIFQPAGVTDYAHHITTCPPPTGFLDHHTALCTYECVCGHPTSKQSPKFYATFLARLDGGTMGP